MKITLALQEKQKEALYKSLETPVLFYGGAKGGGKSFLVRAREIYRRMKYPGTKGLIVRKTYPELLSNHIRMFFTEYPFIRDWFRKGEKAIYWPNGSVTEFSYLKGTDDVYTYQGREYEDISFDEITQHEEVVFKILRSSNRTTKKDVMPTMFLTGNPGGIGHAWVKRLFVDKQYTENERASDFGFVQAKVWDNKILMEADPDYVKRLQDLPDEKRRAYLDGDWDLFSGQVFAEFRRDKHVMRQVVPKRTVPHFLSFDWGYSAPFACYASALIQMKSDDGLVFNRVITYREWFGTEKSPREWAKLIYQTSDIKEFVKAVADASMFNTQSDGSDAISELMQDEFNKQHGGFWVGFEPGTKNRLQRVAAVHNWLQDAPDGLPYWIITENCENLIRTLPLLVYDDHNVEDVDTTQNDHAYDSISYGLNTIKFIGLDVGTVGSRERKWAMTADVDSKGKQKALDLDMFMTEARKKRDWRV